MSKTLGFHLLELNFRLNQCWPISHGLRGFGPIIFVLISILWGFYPLVIEIKNYQVNFGKCLVHTIFISTGFLLIFVNAMMLMRHHVLIKIIKVFSDYSEFGIPRGDFFLERNMKFLLKLCRYLSFILAHIACFIYIIFRDESDNNNNISLSGPYYVNHDLSRFDMTLIILFQIHVIKLTMNVFFLAILLYCYTMTLLIVRIKHLNEIIGGVKLTRDRRMNFKVLRPIVLYHQHIFKMFQLVNEYFTVSMVPTKLCLLLSLTLSSIDISTQNSLISFFIFISNSIVLFALHIFGQTLTSAAESVVQSVYGLNWYEADVSTRKDVFILLCMSQRKMVVELPIFGNVSHEGATKDYKSVYIFFNWMLKIAEKRSV